MRNRFQAPFQTFSTAAKTPPQTKPTTPPTPTQWATQQLSFTPDSHQSLILDTTQNRILVNCSRQWGKSTTAALKALHHALHNPKSLTLILSPSLRQSSELLRKVALFSPKGRITLSSQSLNFPNRSRIIALPGNETTIRGFSSVSLLIVDEAARVPDKLYRSARPFLATTDGTLLLMSTPNGARGFFYNEWASTRDWLRIQVPATECPRISKRFLDEERRTHSERFFRQEYMCEFTTSQSSFIRPDLLNYIKTSHFDPLPL